MKKIAVIGGGISGLSASWLLKDHFDVHLIESQERLGGHANTVSIEGPDGPIPIDTGFLVFNHLNYPHFTEFLKALGVRSRASEMTLSLSSQKQKWEWAGSSISSVFGQLTNAVRPSFLRMLVDIFRFGRDAEDNLKAARAGRWNIQDLVEARKYSKVFADEYLLPMSAAIWSSPEKDIRAFPASVFIEFFINHKLLGWSGRPQWCTVDQGSIQYVQAVEKLLKKVSKNCPVTGVQKNIDGKWDLYSEDLVGTFDHVIFAVAPGRVAKILKTETPEIANFLSKFTSFSNRALLHTDSSVLPKRRRLWSSWNVRVASAKDSDVDVTYFCNALQTWIKDKNYFLSLNTDVKPDDIIKKIDYQHPQFTLDTESAQAELPSLQGTEGLYFCGAWSRYGFHEDGILSAVKVANCLGVETPWKISETRP